MLAGTVEVEIDNRVISIFDGIHRNGVTEARENKCEVRRNMRTNTDEINTH